MALNTYRVVILPDSPNDCHQTFVRLEYMFRAPDLDYAEKTGESIVMAMMSMSVGDFPVHVDYVEEI